MDAPGAKDMSPDRLIAGLSVIGEVMLASEGQLGEFLIGTSNQSEILREKVGIQFLSLRQLLRS